jgi:hypothetical protein
METRGTQLCAIFLVKPDVTIQDHALGSVIGYITIFPNIAPVCLYTSKLRMLQSAINLIVVSRAERRVPCAGVQG